MKKTSKLMALVLVLVVCLTCVLTACCKHNYIDGICTECGKKQRGYEAKDYSYRMAPSDLPTAWNSHTYQSHSSTYVLDYTTDALYAFDYNATGDGFQIVPAMASGDPTDVTANYAGQFGIPADATEQYAYSIPLRDDLKFDNGDPITAATFVESMQLLLNPEAANYRADNVYMNTLKIAGAEAYFKQGTYALSEFVSANYGDDEYVDPANFTTTTDGTLQYNGKDIVLDLNSGGNWGSELSLYASYGYLATFDYDANGRVQYTDAEGNVVYTRVDTDDATAYDWKDAQGNPVAITEGADGWYLGETKLEISSKTKNVDAYTALEAAADEEGWVKLTPATLKNLQDVIAVLHGYNTVEEYAADGAGDYAYQEFEEMAYFGQTYDEFEWSQVGFFENEGNLVVVLKTPMEDNFFLRYELCTSFFLVHPEKYKECISTSGGVYTNNYGTSVDTYIGYGPYKLTNYVADSTIIMEKNLKWWGFSSGEKAEMYQTTKVVYTKVTEDSQRLNMFLKGELESYGLQAADMADYIGSDYIYFNDTESTWYLAMNPGFDSLKANQEKATPATSGNEVNKTIIAIDEFRQALSYSLDRTQFILQLSPMSGVASSLLSSMIVADPESGSSYRQTEEAKDAVLNFWGLADQVGEGKEYATKDEAIASITGYDPTGAKALFQQAYDKAVAGKYLTEAAIASGNWEVQIIVGKPADGNFYNKGYEFLKTNWTEAVEGTPFEGKLVFIQSQTLGSTTFGDYLRDGSVDILFGVGYSGDMFNPYSMIKCFTDNLQYDTFTDKEEVKLDIEINGKTLRASLADWSNKCIMGTEITAVVVGADGQPTTETVRISAGTSADPAVRVKILAAIEGKVMTLSNIFPLMTDASASLKCKRLNYKTEEYILGVGRGGLQYYTYAMDDAEWAAYVTSQGGTLNYK